MSILRFCVPKNDDEDTTPRNNAGIRGSSSSSSSSSRSSTTPTPVPPKKRKHRDYSPPPSPSTAMESSTNNHESASASSSSSYLSNHKKPRPEIILSDEQKYVLEQAELGTSFFFTGKAGTGKSELLRTIVHTLNDRGGGGIYVCAMTGIAALNISGTTLHSFAGIGLGNGSKEKLIATIKRNSKAMKRWMSCRTLIIDEVSMLDDKLFDVLDSIAKAVRQSSLPFGGIQLILCGDFFQLGPVQKRVENDEPVKGLMFKSKAWKECVNQTYILTTVFRQKEQALVDLLQHIRYGRLTSSDVDLLRSLERPLSRKDGVEPVRLFARNEDADAENARYLARLPGAEVIYDAVDCGKSPYVERMSEYCIAPSRLTLKVGASVMLIKNDLEDKMLVNGSLGVVTRIDKSSRLPYVKFQTMKREKLIEKQTWALEDSHGTALATRTTLPLRVSAAISIHKSQGLSLPKVEVNGDNVFADGQFYVAASRAMTLEGLRIVSFDITKIKANPEVVQFYESLSPIVTLAKPPCELLAKT